MNKLQLFTIILFPCLVNIQGQESLGDPARSITEKSGCEVTEAELDFVSHEFRNNDRDNSFLVVIGTSAKKEKQLYNLKRISTVVDYINKRGVEREQIVFAEAQPKDNYGHVEIYINGRLSLVMRNRAKRDFCTSCCNPPF